MALGLLKTFFYDTDGGDNRMRVEALADAGTNLIRFHRLPFDGTFVYTQSNSTYAAYDFYGSGNQQVGIGVDQNGNGGYDYEEIYVNFPPDRPNSPTIGRTGDSVNLSWNNTSWGSYYRIFRNGGLVAEIQGTSWTDNPGPGTWDYQVQPYHRDGFYDGKRTSGVSTTTVDTPPGAPDQIGPSGATGINNPTLQARVTDPNGDNGYANFQVAFDSGFTNVHSNYDGNTVGSGQISTAATSLPANTQFYVRARTVANGKVGPYSAGVAFTTNRPPSLPGAFTAPTAGQVINTTATASWGASTDPDGGSVQYWIDLSTDNGATWTRLVNNITGTSTTIDLTTKPATTTARLRVFAGSNPDTGSYSGNRDSVNFTIQHNSAPLAPTPGLPNGTIFDRSQVNRIPWTHNDPDPGDGQSKYRFRYRVSGSSNAYTDVITTTTNQFYDLPAASVANGTYEYLINTYDSQGVISADSAVRTFVAATVPAGPTITAPTNNAVLGAAAQTVAWSYPTVQSSQVRRVADNAGVANTATVYFDSGEIVSPTQRDLAVTFETNNRFEHVQVRIKEGGLWSAWSSVRVQVSYTVPATPTLTLSPQPDNGRIYVLLNNPTPSGGQPAISRTDLYRKLATDTTFERIAQLTSGTPYYDYTAASGVAYNYYAVAAGVNGTSTTSVTSSATVVLKGTWLHDPADPENTIARFRWDGMGRSSSWTPEMAQLQFVGRRLPFVEFGDGETEVITTSLALDSVETQDLPAMRKLSRRKAILCYRDGRGRKLFVVLPSEDLTDTVWGSNMNLVVRAVDYSEAK